IRHRLDGLLKEVMDLPKWVHEGLIARLKIMAGMDIAEKRLPQDGRLRSTAEDGTEVDFRVSTLRTLFGEKVVMRVLDHRKGVPALEEIGMSAAQTGHLVMSTLHTDNAPSVVTRLMDIGTEPYVIASALVGVIAQRLVRRLCVHCRRQYTPPADTLRALNISDADAAAIP